MAVVLPFSALPAPNSPPSPRRRWLGEILIEAGALDAEKLAAALDQQAQQDQKIGRILVANELISRDDLGRALARQSGLGQIDLAASPADPDLVRGVDPYRCLELEAVPWRQIGGTRVVAIANPDNAEAAMAACGGAAARVALALAAPEDIRRTVTLAFAGRLRDDARQRCPEAFSCRSWTLTRNRRRTVAIGAGVLAAVAAAPVLALQVLMGWILLANAMTMGLRLVALFARVRRGRPEPDAGTPRLADYKKLPRVSILVPLLREEAVAQRLLEALQAMDYPAALLDIKLVLEADDAVTRAAIDRAVLPPTIEVIPVPPDGLKTKPRAMNYALPFCRGDIVGVYDAEDRPEPGQIRAVVSHLQSAPPEVACVQGYLDFYNSSENWLSRCFTLEYAIWFRVVLLGVQRLGRADPARRHQRLLPPQRAGADRRLGRAQRHRGRRPRHAPRPLRLSLRDDRVHHLGGGQLPGAAVDPPAVALAQGLRGHMGHPHAPAGRALPRPRLPRASWASRCSFSAPSPPISRCRSSGRSGPGRSASTSPSGAPSRPG